jgi:hypothetical protein
MSNRPYVAALKAVQELSEVRPDVLAELRLDVLSLDNDESRDPEIVRARERARVLLAELLQDLVESDQHLREERKP